MKAKILLPLLAMAVLVVGVGAVSLNGSLTSAAQSTGAPMNASWTYANQSMRFNRTKVLATLGADAQCRTNFEDSAAPIVSNELNVSLNVSQVDAANARLQANLSSNASSATITTDLKAFRSASAELFWQAMSAAHGLNQTQLQSLKTELNGSYQALGSCVAQNTPLGASQVLRGFGGQSARGFRGRRTGRFYRMGQSNWQGSN